MTQKDSSHDGAGGTSAPSDSVELDKDDAKFSDDGGKASVRGDPSARFGGSIGLAKKVLDFDAANAKELRIFTRESNILVEATDSNRISVVALSREVLGEKDLQVSVSRNIFSVDFRKHGNRWRRMRAGYRDTLKVMIPARLNINVVSHSGDIDISGLHGKVTIKSKSGDIELAGVEGNTTVDARRGSVSAKGLADAKLKVAVGNIFLSRLTGALVCSAKRGDISCQWDSIDNNALVSIRGGRKGISLLLPPDTKLNYRFVLGASAIYNEFERYSASNLLLRIRAARGSISLRKWPPGQA